MAKQTKLEVILDAETVRFRRSLQTALRDVEGFDKKVRQKTGGRGGRGGGILGQVIQGAGVRGLGAGIGVAAITASLTMSVKLSDEMRNIENRVKNITVETGDFAEVWAEIGDISHRNGQTFETSIDTFQRISFARESLQATSDQMLEFVDNVQKLGIVSGSSQQAMKYGLLQLSQGLSQGILRAQEFNSILENLPAVAVELSKAMGVNTGELRQMVVAGKVLSKDVFDAILSRTERINAQFALMEVTIPRAVQSAKNETLLLIREFDKMIGASEKLAKVIQSAADAMADLNEELSKTPDRRQVAQDLENELALEYKILAAKRAKARVVYEDPSLPMASGARVEAGLLLLETEVEFRRLEEELSVARTKSAAMTAPSIPRGQFIPEGGLGFSEAQRAEEEALARRFGTTDISSLKDLAAKAAKEAEKTKGAGLLPKEKPEIPDDLAALPGLEKLLENKRQQIAIDDIRLDMFGETEGAILAEVEAYKMINTATKQLSDLVEQGIITDAEANAILEAKIPLIEAVAVGLGRTAEEQKALTEAQRASEEAFDELLSKAEAFGYAGTDALGDWLFGFESADDAAKNLLKQLFQMVVQMAILTPMAQAFSAALMGGGPLGMFAALFGGARAAGGPTQAGKTYLVGEHGPELRTESASGYIHNASATRSMLGGGGGTVNQNNYFQVDVKNEVRAQLMEAFPLLIEAARGATSADARGIIT